jgi:hypothetical protein
MAALAASVVALFPVAFSLLESPDSISLDLRTVGALCVNGVIAAFSEFCGPSSPSGVEQIRKVLMALPTALEIRYFPLFSVCYAIMLTFAKSYLSVFAEFFGVI